MTRNDIEKIWRLMGWGFEWAKEKLPDYANETEKDLVEFRKALEELSDSHEYNRLIKLVAQCEG